MSAAAETMGLSPNGLAKICDRLLIPHPTRGHWTKTRADQADRPPLPPVPTLDQDVTIARRRLHHAGRARVSHQRRDENQMLDAATRLVVEEGMGAASMKRIAREIA